MLPQAAAEHHLAQQRLTVATLGLTRREWATMGADFDSSWARVGPRITLLTASAQLGAARNGAAYVPLTLAELDQAVDPLAQVDPRGFAGVASDGRRLDSLLYGGVTTAKTAAHTMPPEEALAAGGKWLDMAVQTMVADAARGAAGAAIAARPAIGWIRMVNPPCCKRCATLSGKWFKWNQGFTRHPHCDCYHVPAREMTGDIGFAPDDLIKDGKVTGVTKAERQAIDDGADAISVLNSRRGEQFVGETKTTTKRVQVTKKDGSVVMEDRVVNVTTRHKVDGMFTAEGTTRRGYASYIKREIAKQRGQIAKETAVNVGKRGYVENYTVRRVQKRPTPEAIYRYATSREEAIKLLAQNGYFVGGSIRDVAAKAL